MSAAGPGAPRFDQEDLDRLNRMVRCVDIGKQLAAEVGGFDGLLGEMIGVGIGVMLHQAIESSLPMLHSIELGELWRDLGGEA